MVGENTVEMKKLEEITLEDIQNYLYDNDCDETITTKIVLKKSHKGCCHVYYDENGELRCRDGYDSFVYDGALKTVFKDGEMCYVETFKKIRNRLNGGN